jgi:hypothetical protein
VLCGLLLSKGGRTVSGLVRAGHTLRGCSAFTGMNALWVCVFGVGLKGVMSDPFWKGVARNTNQSGWSLLNRAIDVPACRGELAWGKSRPGGKSRS